MTVGVHEFWSCVLIFCRVAALFTTAPVFGNRSIPKQVKVGLAAVITLAMLPLVGPKVGAAPADLVSMIAQIAAETAVGLCLGFMVQLLLSAFQIAGYYIDTQMGFGIINILNPFTEQQTSAMGQFMYQLSMTLFLIGGGHLFLIGTVAGSYLTVPPGGAQFTGDMSAAFTAFVGQLFVVAVKIAAPAAAVLMVIDVAFAIIARTVPQMNVFIVGMPVKIIVGLLTMAIVLPVLAFVVGHIPSMMSDSAQTVLQAAK
jgi:flagellar biosynthetic protein FliR